MWQRWLPTEQSPPWSFEASAVDLRASWSLGARALVGDASLRMEVRRPPFVRPLDLSIRSRFEVRGHDVALTDLEVEGPGLTAKLPSTNVRLFGPTTAVGLGRVQLDLEVLRPLLDPELPAIAGRLSWPFILDWSAGLVGLPDFRGRDQRRGQLQRIRR